MFYNLMMISGMKGGGGLLNVDSEQRVSAKYSNYDVLLRKRSLFPAVARSPAPAPAPASSLASSPFPGLGRYAAPGKHVVSATRPLNLQPSPPYP